MSMFKDHKLDIARLLGVIPDELLSHLSGKTGVDYYSKVLQGKKLFYLLLYGLLENDRLSQRTLEETFNDPVFKTLFNLDPSETVRRSSISERLSRIDPEYFKQIYEHVYEQFSELHAPGCKEKYNLVRVDSTLVSETCNKLSEGLKRASKSAVKYSIAFDGILPCASEVFTSPEYGSEDIALPVVIRNHVKQETGHQNIYVIDRGLQSARTMREFSDESVPFIARLKENRKHVELESFMEEGSDTDLGDLNLIKDSKVYLYTGRPVVSGSGNKRWQEELVKVPFRLIVGESKQQPGKVFWFVTNEFDLPAREVTDAYRRRWDIEVFFRFIKQELHVSHLVSLNRNGIEVMLYMTLIVSMLVLMYKLANDIGYKTAKRRFTMEMRNLVISMIVTECGGDPTVFFKT